MKAPLDLLHDTLAASEVPHAVPTGELRADLIAHLDALRRALVEGHLGLVVAALHERAAVVPALRPLRDRLTEQGCAPLRALLAGAVEQGSLPADLDEPAALAALEGPVFYRALVRGEPLPAGEIPPLVDTFLAAVRTGACRRRPR